MSIVVYITTDGGLNRSYPLHLTSGNIQETIGSDGPPLIEYFSPVLSIVLGSTGLIFNVINTSVFVHQGVKDCVTLCLLSLSLTDNGSLAFGVMAAGCRMFKTVTEYSGGVYFVDTRSVWLLLVQGQMCFYDLSTYTTAFIAVERCLCVLLPFRFKSIFTFKVSFLILSCIYVTTILFHVFFFAYTEFRTVFNPKLNITQTFIYYSPRRWDLEKYLQVFNNLCMSCMALLIIMVSSGYMIRGLYKSNKFRIESKSLCTPTTSSVEDVIIIGAQVAISSPECDVRHNDESERKTTSLKTRCAGVLGAQNGDARFNSRTLRVVKMIYILAVICFLCDALRFAIMVIFYLNSELTNLTNSILVNVVYFIQVFNCSVNTMVYLTCNHSYRKTFVSLFRVKRNYIS